MKSETDSIRFVEAKPATGIRFVDPKAETSDAQKSTLRSASINFDTTSYTGRLVGEAEKQTEIQKSNSESLNARWKEYRTLPKAQTNNTEAPVHTTLREVSPQIVQKEDIQPRADSIEKKDVYMERATAPDTYFCGHNCASA